MLNDVYGETIIQDFLQTAADGLIAYMDANDRNASGKSKGSIQVVNVTNSTGQLVGAEWIQYVFKGRGPGKLPPLSRIVDWCNARGIPRSYAWVIAKNIAESGTKLWQQRRNIFDEVITKEMISAFVENISQLYTVKLNTEIASLLYTSD